MREDREKFEEEKKEQQDNMEANFRMFNFEKTEFSIDREALVDEQRQLAEDNKRIELKKAQEEEVAKKQEAQKKEEQRVSMIEKTNEGLRAKLEEFKKRNNNFESEVNGQRVQIETLESQDQELLEGLAAKEEDQRNEKIRDES
ncbi:hypothetical protein CAEBREN_19814 [Caenorhabditis brenneri]|uniref:Uncharacterized protein n=1 Tax=Caenorhabditis brenneri TaxID=135651 RepID=G0P934_CAEBE|nr:hypothetical protein CAEBREN_19814 [Caenorhabditis brenneri]